MILQIPLLFAIYLVIGELMLLASLYTKPGMKSIRDLAEQLPLPNDMIYVVISLSLALSVLLWLPMTIWAIMKLVNGEKIE